MKCLDCKQDAVWVRRTQFAGNHPFCDDHARKEKDFKEDGGSYFYWSKKDSSDKSR